MYLRGVEPRPDVDLLDGDFYVSDPYPTYAWMRDHEPVYWDATNELWGISRYDDVREIEQRNDVFVSSDQTKGGYRPNLPADPAFIGIDDPEHQRRRALVARRFTPRAVRGWESLIRAKVTALLDAALATSARGDTVDVVEQLAAPLPAMMIGRLLGFPDDEWPQLKHWSETTIALGGGPRYLDDAGVHAAGEFAVRALELYAEKQTCPMDDVLSVWSTAEIDGRPLTLEEVAADCLLILDGGAETTRTVIARTLLNLQRHPEQWDRLRAGADLTAATEEFIRYVSPIHNMCRVARADHRLHDTVIPAGHQVVLMYPAANRDPRHFADPERLDVTRAHNDHLAFGFGTHFCLGASLARLEIRVFFEEFLRRVDSYRIDESTLVEQPNAFVFGVLAGTIDLQPT
jgi:cytochrome P450 family 142 subfamily A polypeptide 1